MNLFSKRNALSENQVFWLLQLTGWFSLALLTYLSLTIVYNQGEWQYVLHPFVQSLIGIFVSWPMRGIFRSVWDSNIPVRLLAVVLSVLFFSLIWNYLRLISFIWMTGEQMDFYRELSVWYFSGALVFACWAAFYHGFRYFRLQQAEHESLMQAEREKQAEQLRRENAERLTREAQLKMLQYQLNPHFLFNTLNAITSLVNTGRNTAATEMVDALSAFLRDALKGDPLHRVTLREEIASLKNYLGIEQTRFGERLHVDVDSAGADMEFRVPGLILQPLAENVIKHAVRPASGTVSLQVIARMAGERLEIELNDDGPGIPGLEEGGLPEGGLGLQNVLERLTNMYGTDHAFRLESRESGGLRVSLDLPPHREPAEQAANPDGGANE